MDDHDLEKMTRNEKIMVWLLVLAMMDPGLGISMGLHQNEYFL
jgi:hypothetical protein